MKDNKITIFKRLKETQIPYYITLEKALNRIKTGEPSKEFITHLRTLKKEDYQKQKTNLPCIVFSGEFKERNKNGLTTHSGLMITDFDKYPSKEIMLQQFNELKKNKHIVAIFISPSDIGLKALVRIPKSDKITHEKYFKQFNSEFEYEYFDKSNCNVDRICFESYDPNIYINYEAEEYKPTLIDEGYKIIDRVPLIPINDEMTIISKIMKFKWSKDFVDGERNNYILDVAGAFCEYGISKSTAEGYILNNIVYGKFSQSETINTIRSAYKIRGFNTKYFEDYTQINNIKVDLKKGKEKVLEKYKIDEDTYNEIKIEAETEDFWTLTEKNKISINPLKYKRFLENNGFKKHFPNDADKPSFVFIESNKVELTSTSKIKDFVLDYLMSKKQLDVWNYCAVYQNLFSEQYLTMLESIDLMMLSDTKTTSYFAFSNGILEVKKDSLLLKEYVDVDGYVWKTHILDREWKTLKEFDNDYSKFISNVSSKEPLAIECVIGYMISTYKNRSNNKAIILNDEVISDNPEGGTGKGLFVQGLSNIRKTSIIDGKKYDGKNQFANQTISIDTKILVFDDIKKNWDFESQFSLVTEGITLERKNKDAIKLNVHESPKILLSTNYAVKGEGNSHNRRRHEIEIAQYYGDKLTPEDEFGRQLFDDWSELEYQKYDNYMMSCLQSFFNNGLIKQTNAKNIKMRKLIAESSMEFIEWIEDRENVSINVRLTKSEYFVKFTEDYTDYKKWLTKKRFNIWIKKYAKYKGLKFDENRTNGISWFSLEDGKADELKDEVPF